MVSIYGGEKVGGFEGGIIVGAGQAHTKRERESASEQHLQQEETITGCVPRSQRTPRIRLVDHRERWGGRPPTSFASIAKTILDKNTLLPGLPEAQWRARKWFRK